MNTLRFLKIIFSLATLFVGVVVKPASMGASTSFPRTRERNPDIADELGKLVYPIGRDIEEEIGRLKINFQRELERAQAAMKATEADASEAGKAAKRAAEEAAQRAFTEFQTRVGAMYAQLQQQFRDAGSAEVQKILRDLSEARAALAAAGAAYEKQEATALALAREKRAEAVAAEEKRGLAALALQKRMHEDALLEAERKAERDVANAKRIAEAQQAAEVEGMVAKMKAFLGAFAANGESLEGAIKAAGPHAEKMMETYVEGQKKLQAAAHEQWKEKANQVFDLVGNFVGDRKKLANTGGTIALTFGAAYALKKGTELGYHQAEKYLNTPKIVEKTNVPTWFQTIFGMPKVTFPLIKDVMLDAETREEAVGIASAIRNTAKHQGFFRNYVFWGASGTGKTMMAEALANECNCYYVLIAGSSLFKLPTKDALVQIDKLFDWANAQSKPVMIIIDEAENLFRQRDASLSEETRHIMTYMMTKLGTESRKLLAVALTNRPQEFDEAIKTRFPVRIEFKRPALDQRIAILESNIKRMLTASKIDTALLSKEKVHGIAAKTEGMCGRDLMYLVVGIRDSMYESAGNKLTMELIDKAVARSLKSFAAELSDFERTDDKRGRRPVAAAA